MLVQHCTAGLVPYADRAAMYMWTVTLEIDLSILSVLPPRFQLVKPHWETHLKAENKPWRDSSLPVFILFIFFISLSLSLSLLVSTATGSKMNVAMPLTGSSGDGVDHTPSCGSCVNTLWTDVTAVDSKIGSGRTLETNPFLYSLKSTNSQSTKLMVITQKGAWHACWAKSAPAFELHEFNPSPSHCPSISREGVQ